MTERTRATVEMLFSNGDGIATWDEFDLRENFTDPAGSFSFVGRPPRNKIEEFDKRLKKGQVVTIKINGHQQCKPLITTKTVSVGRNGVEFRINCKSLLATMMEVSIDPFIHKAYKSSVTISEAVKQVAAIYGFTGEIKTDPEANIAIQTGAGGAGGGSSKKKAGISFAQDLFQRFSGTVAGESGSESTSVGVGGSSGGAKHNVVQAQFGETAYQYLVRLMLPKGLALNLDVDGNLLVTKPHYDQAPLYSLLQEMSPSRAGDRMLDDFSLMETNDGQFSEVVLFGNGSDDEKSKRTNAPIHRAFVADLATRPGMPFASKPSTPITDDLKKATDGRYHQRYSADISSVYKPAMFKHKDMKTQDECSKLASLHMGRTSREAMKLECTVDGLVSSTNKIWATNTIANVFIEALNFESPMWIIERSMSMSRSEGQTTRLVLIPLGSLILEEPPPEKS